VAMGDRKFLWLILVSVAINRLCTLLPTGILFSPFPLYEMQISLQSYVYFITVHLSIMIIWMALSQLESKFSSIFHSFFKIEVLSLIDFFLIYEHPWFHIGSYGVEFTDIKILLYTYFIFRWNSTGNS
jgi:hypothetical protein